MPAVKTFAMYAAVAILLNFLFQISAFVAIMSLDQKRVEEGRLDLFCCVRIKGSSEITRSEIGILQKFFENFYTPFILSK